MGRLVLFVLLLCCQFSVAQKRAILGVVVDSLDLPIPNVSVRLQEFSLGTYTDHSGRFTLDLPDTKVAIEISYLGFVTQVVPLLDKDLTQEFRITLLADELGLDEVVVTAQKKESTEGTSSYKIESQAIAQIQAFNLGDVLGLLPGQKAIVPDLTEPGQANLRSAYVKTNYIISGPIANSAATQNAFGTAVILNGTALSNDANLQASNPAASSFGGKAVTGGGIDLRGVSLASVASVEVVSGVASAKYGNLSSGAIIVKNKVGQSPWLASANISSTNYQATVAKGFGLKGAGVLNADFSYSYTSGEPTERKEFYQGVNLGLRWKLPTSKKLLWNHFTSLRLAHSNDGQRHEPDEVFPFESDVKSTSYQIALSGDFKSVLGKVGYNVSGSVTQQYSYSFGTAINGPFPIIEAMESGVHFTTFTPTAFPQSTEIKGRPINFNARLSVSDFYVFGKFDLNSETGIQFNYDDNTGSGRVTDGSVVLTSDIVGSRSASFHGVPASKTTSVYHQSKLRHKGKTWDNTLNLGLRYDYMLERYHLWAPRLSWQGKTDKFNFRSAWGLSYKAPAMIQLYPGKSYIDYTNLSFYAENPLERLAIVTTYVHQPSNTHLKPSYVDLKEVGLDWNPGFLKLQFTYFKKKLHRGLSHADELLVLPKQNFEVVDRPIDQPPIVRPIPGDISPIPRTLKIIKNNLKVDTDGVELVLSPKKIKATNTEFNFRYSYLQSLYSTTGFNIKGSSFVVGDNTARFGVYEYNPKRVISSFGTLTTIQHIPALRFIVTLATELHFKSSAQSLNASLYPFAYYDIAGNYNPLSQEERQSPEFADLKLPATSFRIQEDPFYMNFNLQVRKETKQGHSFSFFANNAPWYNPEFEVEESRRRYNQKLSVGFRMAFRIN
jgi:hypothetical protein